MQKRLGRVNRKDARPTQTISSVSIPTLFCAAIGRIVRTPYCFLLLLLSPFVDLGRAGPDSWTTRLHHLFLLCRGQTHLAACLVVGFLPRLPFVFHFMGVAAGLIISRAWTRGVTHSRNGVGQLDKGKWAAEG